jgi:hypothetical protein
MQETIRQVDEADFPKRQKFIDLHEQGKLPGADAIAKIVMDIALSEWPELSGTIDELRSPDFQKECRRRGISILEEQKPR